MGKIKLLIFHPVIAPYRVDFFNSLIRAFEVRLCLTHVEENLFNFETTNNKLAVTPVVLGSRFRFNNTKFTKGVLQQIRTFNPNIVLVGEFGFCTIVTLLYRFLMRKHYKVVTICDDSYNMLSENNDFSIGHRLARNIIPRFLDEIIVVEPKVRNWYQKYFHKGVFFPIIRSGKSQIDIYRRTFETSKQLMKTFQLEKKNVFLFVGRFVSLKNIDGIIKAFSELDNSKNALVLVGDGEELEHLKKLDAELETNVIFTGRLEGDDLYAWYNVADYFILASFQEAFGAVTNEALLAGCPCIISQRAGSKCLIEEGKNGYLINPTSKRSIVEAMNQVIATFPKKRPFNEIKESLMIYDYDEMINNLIGEIKFLVRET